MQLYFKPILLFLSVVVSLVTSCSPKKLDPLTIYFQRIEQLKVKDLITGYDQKRTEKQTQFLWVRAREFGFSYGKDGVLQIIEETKTRDGKQEKFLIVLLTKNKRLDIRRIDYKLQDTIYKKKFQKILESANWHSLKKKCKFVTKKECEIYRGWVSVAMTPELRATLQKVNRHTVFRLYDSKNILYYFDARDDWPPTKDSPRKDKLKKEEKSVDDFLKEFHN